DQPVEQAVENAELLHLVAVDRRAELLPQPLQRRLERLLELPGLDGLAADASDLGLGRLFLEIGGAGVDAPETERQDQQGKQPLDDDPARFGADCLQHMTLCFGRRLTGLYAGVIVRR